METKIQNVDRKIIEVLTKNGRATIREIAAHLNVSQPTVRKRIRYMLENSIIDNFACDINMEKFGYNMSFFSLVKITNATNSEQIAKKLIKIPEIQSVDMITGEYDIIIRAFAKDQKDLYNILTNIQNLEGIEHLFTNIIIKSLGHKTVIPK
jgi:Lrp/AsnC family transcriptional regulator for asnA, asnC and gidA